MTLCDGDAMYPAMLGYKSPYQRRQEAKRRRRNYRLHHGLHLPKRLRNRARQ